MSMSIAEYREAVKSSSRGGRNGRILRLATQPTADAKPLPIHHSDATSVQVADVVAPTTKSTSAAKARNRTKATLDSLKTARVDVDYEPTSMLATIRFIGGTTLPPNRVLNIARGQSKLSQRTFSAYKHACADRASEAVMLLRSLKGGPIAFAGQIDIEYERVVQNVRSKLDADAVTYSFKYVLDGFVSAGMLQDDTEAHVRIVSSVQRVEALNMLVIKFRGV